MKSVVPLYLSYLDIHVLTVTQVFEASRLKTEALDEQQKKMEVLSTSDHKVALLATDIGKHIVKAK